MKTLLIFLISTSFLAAQFGSDCSFSARYNFSWLTDSINIEYKSEEYNLVRTQYNVYFFNQAAEHNDSIYTSAGFNMKNTKDKEQNERFQKSWNDGAFSSVIKFNKSHLVYLSELGTKGRNYVRYRDFTIPMYYSLPVEIPKWEITKEKDSLNGLIVIKALTTYAGRNYIAWFSPTIPINEGPYVFRNLPGLVIKVHDDDKKFVFDLKSYKNSPEKCFVELDIDWIHREVKYDEWVRVRTKNYYEPRMSFQTTNEAKERYRKSILVNGRYLLLER